jgi:hypothetical protein
VLTGALPDQAALFGVLGHIEALGLELLEVRAPAAEAWNRRPETVDHQSDVMPAHQARSQAGGNR